MEKPHLNRIWETYVEIPMNDQKMSYSNFLSNAYNTLRLKVHPLVLSLVQNGTKWYCFLFHASRVLGDPKRYWHMRFEPKKGIDDKEKVKALLPDYCQMTELEKVEDVRTIGGIDESLIRDGEIEEAWRILGEQSEWFLNMLETHKDGIKIPSKQIGQFLHFFFNMSQVLFTCPCCGNVFNGGRLVIFEL